MKKPVLRKVKNILPELKLFAWMCLFIFLGFVGLNAGASYPFNPFTKVSLLWNSVVSSERQGKVVFPKECVTNKILDELQLKSCTNFAAAESLISYYPCWDPAQTFPEEIILNRYHHTACRASRCITLELSGLCEDSE